MTRAAEKDSAAFPFCIKCGKMYLSNEKNIDYFGGDAISLHCHQKYFCKKS